MRRTVGKLPIAISTRLTTKTDSKLKALPFFSSLFFSVFLHSQKNRKKERNQGLEREKESV